MNLEDNYWEERGRGAEWVGVEGSEGLGGWFGGHREGVGRLRWKGGRGATGSKGGGCDNRKENRGFTRRMGEGEPGAELGG